MYDKETKYKALRLRLKGAYWSTWPKLSIENNEAVCPLLNTKRRLTTYYAQIYTNILKYQSFRCATCILNRKERLRTAPYCLSLPQQPSFRPWIFADNSPKSSHIFQIISHVFGKNSDVFLRKLRCFSRNLPAFLDNLRHSRESEDYPQGIRWAFGGTLYHWYET